MENPKPGLDRRGFLAGATAGAVGLVAPRPALAAEEAQEAPQAAAQTARPVGTAAPPSARAVATETEPVSMDGMLVNDAGSDFMVDVLKSLGFEYVAANPGSSFRGLHESIVNYGGNKSPELLTCCHEESSVAIADGYFRVEGKPMAVMAHGT